MIVAFISWDLILVLISGPKGLLSAKYTTWLSKDWHSFYPSVISSQLKSRTESYLKAQKLLNLYQQLILCSHVRSIGGYARYRRRTVKWGHSILQQWATRWGKAHPEGEKGKDRKACDEVANPAFLRVVGENSCVSKLTWLLGDESPWNCLVCV